MHLPIQRPHTSPFDALPTTASAATNMNRSASAASPASPADSSSNSSTTSTATITANDFLQLLVTELQNQDPTADTDPNEYVDQLVQVNSLQQLIQINQNTEGTGSSGSSSSVASDAIPGHGAPSAVSPANPAAGSIHTRPHGNVAHGNLSPNQVQPPNFSAAANQVAGALAPGHGDALRTQRPPGARQLSGIPLQ